MKFTGAYGIIVGLLMLGQWGLFLAAGQVPELKTESIRLAFHLVAEFATAVTLVVASLALFRRASWATSLYLVAAGMLVYSVVVSPGYFAQRGQWVFVGMFGLLFLLALACIWQVTRTRA